MVNKKNSGGFLVFAIFMGIAALCAIVYELLIADVLSYLLGDSVLYFSITIGLFLSSMGLGSFISYKISDDSSELLRKIVVIELLLGFVGGFSIAIIHYIASYSIRYARYNYESFLGSTIPLHIISFLLIITIGVFVGLEIPLLTRIVNKKSELKYSLAYVLAADYVGSFIGSLAFPLLLLPYLGVIKTSFLTGILNASSTFIVLGFYRIKNYKTYLFVTSLLVIILGIFFLNSSKLENYYDNVVYTYEGYSEIVASIQSPYQKIVLTKHNDGKKDFITLFLNGIFQFDSEKEGFRYHDIMVHPAFQLANKSENVLILGGGDGLPAKEVLRHKNVKRIVNVDIDHVIVEFSKTNNYMTAYNNFSFHNKKLEMVIQDAFIYARNSNEKFDIIIVDFPEGNDVSLSRSYSLQFIKDLKRILNDGGVITFQADDFKFKSFYNLLKTIKVAGLYFISLPIPREDNPNPEDSTSLRSGEAIILVSKNPIISNSLISRNMLGYFTYKDVWVYSFKNRVEESHALDKLKNIRYNSIYRPTYLHYYRQDFFTEYDVGL